MPPSLPNNPQSDLPPSRTRCLARNSGLPNSPQGGLPSARHPITRRPSDLPHFLSSASRKEYVLLHDLPAHALEESASSLIREGYIPLGGVVVEGARLYCQAFWHPPAPTSAPHTSAAPRQIPPPPRRATAPTPPPRPEQRSLPPSPPISLAPHPPVE